MSYANDFNEINKRLKRGGKKLIDIVFPPTDAALYGSNPSYVPDTIVHWRRPCEFLEGSNEIQVFFETAEPNDIK